MSGPAALLLRYAPPPADSDAVPRLIDAVVAAYPALFECAEANRALDGSHLYIFFWSRNPAVLSDGVEASVSGLARQLLPGTFESVRLWSVQDMPGVSYGSEAGYHYVVETDIQPAIAQELNDWYQQEHMPGLASVPGNVRARRLESTNSDGTTRSLACYDLTTPDTQQSDPWEAVRATQWAGEVRPYFSNTRRVMCKRLYLRDTATGTL